ncbi:hypothetical protein DBV15_01495 [Temnothorax longispinosus]|uniref:Uncharacterized protein n=1 Tax=Temnothorax longispinosus TaxID=300112 RepID=A0A4S2KU56_9HYME|nr:hypothetical protein DBV15_01495 [Temnothorax longispinosus]
MSIEEARGTVAFASSGTARETLRCRAIYTEIPPSTYPRNEDEFLDKRIREGVPLNDSIFERENARARRRIMELAVKDFAPLLSALRPLAKRACPRRGRKRGSEGKKYGATCASPNVIVSRNSKAARHAVTRTRCKPISATDVLNRVLIAILEALWRETAPPVDTGETVSPRYLILSSEESQHVLPPAIRESGNARLDPYSAQLTSFEITR